MNGFRVASIAAVTLVAMAGCGGDGSDDAEQDGSAADTGQAVVEGEEQAAPPSEQDVAGAFEQELDAKPDPDDIVVATYPAPGASQPCFLMQVLETPDEIETWRAPEFDEPVVTNPDGTVGVQINTLAPEEQESCIQAAEGVLEGF